jgi:hypothetical protein
MSSDYQQKYYKYKTKYLNLLNQIAGHLPQIIFDNLSQENKLFYSALSVSDKNKISKLLTNEIDEYFNLSNYYKLKLLNNKQSLDYYFTLSDNHKRIFLLLSDKNINFLLKLTSNNLKENYLKLLENFNDYDNNNTKKIYKLENYEIMRILKADEEASILLIQNFEIDEIRIIIELDKQYDLINNEFLNLLSDQPIRYLDNEKMKEFILDNNILPRQ